MTKCVTRTDCKRNEDITVELSIE